MVRVPGVFHPAKCVGREAQEGSYDGELNIIAFNPNKNHLVHIEPSMDADSWKMHEVRFKRKFDLGRKHILQLFRGMTPPKEIEQIALLEFASKQNHTTIGGGRIVIVSQLLKIIIKDQKAIHLAQNIVSEHLPILTGFPFVSTHWNDVCNIFEK